VPKNNLHIDVLGTSITIAADEEEAYLKSLLETYKKQVENIRSSTGLQDSLKIAVLAGFVLCDEVEKASKKTGEEEKAAEELTLNIISRLDEALEAPEKPAAPGSGRVYQAYKLKNPVKNYDWGSPRWLPEFLGERNISRIPWAELWMGVHPLGPSRITGEEGEGGGEPLLQDLIARNPRYFLGEETERDFGALPFLFKVLAAAKPLSIQAHPNAEQARQGWERENSGAVPPDAPERNYKDPNPKPEILCALSRFKALCGFRPPEEIRGLLEIFGADPGPQSAMESLASALDGPGDSPLGAFLSRLYSLDPETLARISEYGRSQTLEEAYPEYSEEWALIRKLAGLYPGDSGVAAPLYLNLLDLAPGEAIYLPAGILHAYVHGMGVELMANSDNVLRGGLTSKYIDLKELFRVLVFSPFRPQVLRPGVRAENGTGSLCFKYPAPCGEFSLSLIKGGDNVFSSKGPSIVLVTEGELVIDRGEGGDSGKLRLRQGESAFVPAGGGEVRLSGAYTLYAAGAGENR
jgi:mannose-6-phosphate isomerase